MFSGSYTPGTLPLASEPHVVTIPRVPGLERQKWPPQVEVI